MCVLPLDIAAEMYVVAFIYGIAVGQLYYGKIVYETWQWKVNLLKTCRRLIDVTLLSPSNLI